MTQKHQLQSLQNAADTIGLEIHQKLPEDKRKTVPTYFAQKGISTVSPVLNYEQMNHFLWGWIKAMRPDSIPSSSGFENGEIVWDTNNLRYGVVLNNYGMNHYGEIRLDSDGNRPIEDLRKLGSEGDAGSKQQLIECLLSHKRLLDISRQYGGYERVFY